ncbi:hypothetical protein CSUI_006861, partial [Cystoisospora suis]
YETPEPAEHAAEEILRERQEEGDTSTLENAKAFFESFRESQVSLYQAKEKDRGDAVPSTTNRIDEEKQEKKGDDGEKKGDDGEKKEGHEEERRRQEEREDEARGQDGERKGFSSLQ